MEEQMEEQKKFHFKELVSLILAAYQVFLPIFLCVAAGLTAAFAVLVLFLGR